MYRLVHTLPQYPYRSQRMEFVNRRTNRNRDGAALVVGTTHMTMALPTYARADRVGEVHDLVVDTSGFNKDEGTVSQEVVGRIIKTFIKNEPNNVGVVVPKMKCKIHWIDG